jgi:hypothetical protein
MFTEITRIHADDSAENSIMQTITIAVSAILIAAGLVTAPGLINNARDNNARTDLANIATGQEFRLADIGKYTSSLDELETGTQAKITLSLPKSSIRVISGSDCYAVFGKSESGKTFYRTSGSAEVKLAPATWSTSAPAGYPANCAWPTDVDSATASPVSNLVSTSIGNWNTGRWFGGGSGAGVYSTVTNDTSSPWGAYNRKTWNASGNTNGDTGFDIQQVSVKPGKSYTLSAWLRPSTTQFGSVSIYWLDSDGQIISRSDNPRVSMAAGKWTRISGTATAPANTSKALLIADSNEGGAQWKPGDTLDGTAAMFTEGTTLYDFADGNTPGWTWNGPANASSSSGIPYTLNSVAGAPVENAINSPKGTVLDTKFTGSHTAVSVVDTTTNGQLGWLSSLNYGSDNFRLEALNIHPTIKNYYLRGQVNGGSSYATEARSPVYAERSGLDIVTTEYNAEDNYIGIGMRDIPALQKSGITQNKLPADYQLRTGVRDLNPEWGVAANQIAIYDRALTDTERLAVVKWMSNHYGIA